jgi:type III secretion protein T
MDGSFPSILELTYALILGSARFFGVFLMFPLFTMAGIVGLYAYVFAAAFAMPFVVEVYNALIGQTIQFGASFMLLTLKEFGLGFAIGAAIALPFWVVQAAGDVVDHTRGASMGNTVDPVNSSETTTLGALLMVAALFYFAATGGVFRLVEIVHDSYKAWPMLSPMPDFGSTLVVQSGALLTAIGRNALIVGAPILLAMAAIDLTLLLMGRMAGQLQIFDLGNTFKNVAMVLLMPVFMLFFASYFDLLDARVPELLGSLTGVSPGAPAGGQ